MKFVSTFFLATSALPLFMALSASADSAEISYPNAVSPLPSPAESFRYATTVMEAPTPTPIQSEPCEADDGTSSFDWSSVASLLDD